MGMFLEEPPKDLLEMHLQNTARFAAVEERQARLEISLKENTEDTRTVKEDVKTLLTIVQTSRTSIRYGMKFGRWMSHFAHWLIPIVGLASILWGICHGRPPWKE